MGKGGARVNSGPPPDPNALRRDRPADLAGWVTLPAEGRKGRAPAWPLPPEVRLSTMLDLAETEREMLEVQIDAGSAPRSAPAKLAKLDQKVAVLKAQLKDAAKRESVLWRAVWSTPQAVMWERSGYVREVALYVRWQVQAELGDIDAGKEARQWSDRLGLNPNALLRLRWKIAGPEADEATRPRRTTSSSSSSRARLRVVGGEGG